MIRPLPSTKDSHIIPLKMPRELVDRIDAFAGQHGFKTRTGAIIRLLVSGLDVYSAKATETN